MAQQSAQLENALQLLSFAQSMVAALTAQVEPRPLLPSFARQVWQAELTMLGSVAEQSVVVQVPMQGLALAPEQPQSFSR